MYVDVPENVFWKNANITKYQPQHNYRTHKL